MEDNNDYKVREKTIRVMRKIIILDIKKEIFLVELAKKLKMPRNHPDLYEALKIMEEKSLMTKKDYFGNLKIIKINNELLEEYIRENSEDFKEWGKFIEATVMGFNY